ncbi:MAG TPA: adenylate/guanylate cyclase domain-containing protein [Candidatus Limnocylindria bacterium]|nr:adenylate/guanylate cyclase domain-containing protein [Candidatus Limnocylindria bacterium]
MACGRAVGPASAGDLDRQLRLAAGAPAPLVDKMRRSRLSGERKPVTALFADVVGSTSLAERMDPEDWTQMMNQVFELMSQAVFRYEGTIAQLQGDAMLAFFGAPIAHEDDPERAVRAALDMVTAADEFARQLKAAQGTDFRIRAGINSGPVVVGNVGNDLRYEYTALGDAVNVAARAQAAAEPGTVLITAATQRFVAATFEFADLGLIEVKGKAERVHAYRVVGIRADPARRRGLQAVGLTSPMVGRATELEALVRQYAVAAAGSNGLSWYEGRCVSYGRTLPYHLVLDLVRSVLGIPAGASEAEESMRLRAGVAALLGSDAGDSEPYLGHLLGLRDAGQAAEQMQLDPETMQGRYVAASHRLLRARATQGPIVIVLEDIHWADPASVEVLLQLLPLTTSLPILVVAAGRAETDAPGWRLVANARATFGDTLVELRLEPLDAEQSRALVGNLLEIESLPEVVRQTILARSEGNPFFVEEVIRMLIEQGAIAQQDGRWLATDSIASVEIPANLQLLLLARIDQLPDEAKRSLRVASVIGRQFPVRVLEHVLTNTES